MARIFAPLLPFLIGGAFVLTLLIGLLTPAEKEEPQAAHVYHLEPKPLALASNGVLGRFDNRQLQRGFQVYKEVCSACHSMHRVAFRDLEQIGFSKAEVKAIAKGWATEVPSINDKTGEATTRKALPTDYIPGPYANEVAARQANNNALPPDMSLLAKAREGGANYIHSLITGYRPQPESLLKRFPDAKTPPGLYYNPYFANLNIAMPPPLVADGQVTYADGTKATVEQMSRDISAFLVWTAEPKLQARHRAGVAVIIFLLIATGLAYGAYQNIWRQKKH